MSERGRLLPARALFNVVWLIVLIYASYRAIFAAVPVLPPAQQITPPPIKPTPLSERPKPAKEAVQPPRQEVPPVPAKPALPLASISPDSGAIGDYTLLLRECHHTDDAIWCSAQATNLTDARATFITGSLGNSVDDEGNSAQIMFGSIQQSLIPGVATNVQFRIYDKHQSVQSVNLDLNVCWEIDRDTCQHLIYKDVPVQ